MRFPLLLPAILPLAAACQYLAGEKFIQENYNSLNIPQRSRPHLFICEILVPQGYQRVHADKNSFGYWLRNLPLKQQNLVRLYNGQLKPNQSAHFAVIDMPIRKKFTTVRRCGNEIKG